MQDRPSAEPTRTWSPAVLGPWPSGRSSPSARGQRVSRTSTASAWKRSRGWETTCGPRRSVRCVQPANRSRIGQDDAVTPETKYAKSGDVHIAYQVLGQGPIDLIFIPGWVTHVELAWENPFQTRFLTRLASFSRLILFDKRGVGLSDRV